MYTLQGKRGRDSVVPVLAAYNETVAHVSIVLICPCLEVQVRKSRNVRTENAQE